MRENMLYSRCPYQNASSSAQDVRGDVFALGFVSGYDVSRGLQQVWHRSRAVVSVLKAERAHAGTSPSSTSTFNGQCLGSPHSSLAQSIAYGNSLPNIPRSASKPHGPHSLPLLQRVARLDSAEQVVCGPEGGRLRTAAPMNVVSPCAVEGQHHGMVLRQGMIPAERGR